MKRLSHWILRILLGCYLIIAGGCGGQSRPADFYLLHALEQPAADQEQAATATRLAVGPVYLPSYLQQRQLVIRSGENGLDIWEYSRWGEPLAENMQRVLIENLSVLLKKSVVYDYGQHRIKGADLQLQINFRRFDVADNGQGVLTAFWTVTDENGFPLRQKETTLYRTGTSLQPAEVVHVLNQLLLEFSKDLAMEIQALR